MKIDGVDLSARVRDTVRIPKRGRPAIEVEIEAYPFGFDVAEYLPYPLAPVTAARKQGGEVIRDSAGRVELVRNEQDLAYRQARDRIFWMRVAALFYFAVEPIGRIKFATVEGLDPKKEPEKFFALVAEEIKASGLSTGDISLVNEAAERLSNMGDRRLEEAEADFTPPPPEANPAEAQTPQS